MSEPKVTARARAEGPQAPPQQPQNTSSATPNEGERITHPPAGQAVKVDPDGSGRAAYPADRPELYGRPTDADGRRER